MKPLLPLVLLAALVQVVSPSAAGARALLSEATVLFEEGDLDAAERRAEAALSSSRSSSGGDGGSSGSSRLEQAAAHQLLGKVLTNQAGRAGQSSRVHDAFAHFRRATALAREGGGGAALLLLLGAALRDFARVLLAVADDAALAEAVGVYEELLRLEPRDAAAHHLLGRVYSTRGRTAESVASYRTAVALRPDLEAGVALTHLAFGLAKRPSGREEAQAVLRRAIAVAPASSSFHSQAGTLFFRRDAPPPAADAPPRPAGLGALKRTAEAEHMYRRAAQLAPALAAPLLDLGLTLYGAGRLDEAEVSYRRAAQLNPEAAHARPVFLRLPRADPAYARAHVTAAGSPHRGMVLVPRLFFPFDEGYATASSSAIPSASAAHAAPGAAASAVAGDGIADAADEVAVSSSGKAEPLRRAAAGAGGGWGAAMGRRAFRPALQLLQPHAACAGGRSLDSFGADAAAAAAAGVWGVPRRVAAVHARRLFSPGDCAMVVAEAEAHAEAHEGWSTARHVSVPTTDLAVARLPRVRAWLNEQLERAILPAFEHLYGVPRESLWLNDAFVVRYRHGEQDSLPPHADQSRWSAVIGLNDRAEYGGGGTHFEALNRTVVAEAGEIVAFHGKMRHGGAAVTRGVRYVLALFVMQDPAVAANVRPREAYIAPGAEGAQQRHRFLRCNDDRQEAVGGGGAAGHGDGEAIGARFHAATTAAALGTHAPRRYQQVLPASSGDGDEEGATPLDGFVIHSQRQRQQQGKKKTKRKKKKKKKKKKKRKNGGGSSGRRD